MKIYEKIVRKINNIDGDISTIIKKDTLRKIRKDIEVLKNNNIVFGIEQLTSTNLMDFYQNIYVPIIGSKDNAKINNILEKLTPSEIEKNNRFFIFIKKGNILLGGGIFNYIDKKLKFSYKGNIKEEIDLKAGFGTLIDFLFFSFGIERSVDYFSYGTDRNGYGGLGSSYGVCFHKLLLGFRPYNFDNNTTIEIEDKTINKPTIIFDNPNINGEFQDVILLNSGEENNINTDIIIKKGFKIKYT